MSESGYAAKYGYGKSGELCDTELYNIELYDMEAAAGYQAAHHFFGPHQMFFIKIISVNGVQEKMSADTVRELVQAQIDRLRKPWNGLRGRKRLCAGNSRCYHKRNSGRQNVLVMICTVPPSWKQNCSSC